MALRVAELAALLGRLAPAELAAPWDNPGLQVGDADAQVSRLLVALDPTPAALAEAARLGCQALVTHHPLILEPIRSVRLDEPLGAALGLAVRSGIAIIAAHTNLDAAPWGTSQVLAERLGLTDITPLGVEAMARLGLLPGPVDLAGLAALCRERLQAVAVRCVEGRGGPIRKVAVCGGSGGSLLGAALQAGAEVMVTGDVRYHQAREFEGRLAIVDCGHFGGERPVLGPLAERLAAALSGLAEVSLFAGEHDPFKLY